MGRGEINREFLKRFGKISIPGLGCITLLHKNALKSEVSVHFTPDIALYEYIHQENNNGD